MYILMNSVRNTFSGIQSSVGQSVGQAVGIASDNTPQLDWTKIILIIVVLSLLGLNVFAYLGQISEWFSRTFGPIFRSTVGTAVNVVGDTATQTIQTAAKGTEAVVRGVSQGATTGIGELQQALGGQLERNHIDGRRIENRHTRPKHAETNFVMDQDDDDVDTSIVSKTTKGINHRTSAGGFCYIGTDRGVRSCMQVGEGDRCMSNQIFPSMDICINPSLRE